MKKSWSPFKCIACGMCTRECPTQAISTAGGGRINDITQLELKQLKELRYEKKPIDKGYNNRTLYVNVSDLEIQEKPVTQEMKDKFVGGKGFGLKLLWDATRPDTRWNDPDNEIVISPGPVAGITQYPGSGKSLVVSISPATDLPIDSNVGGYFGPYMKFAGI
jgi:aldehyde:ferredoxin oxidoreductase